MSGGEKGVTYRFDVCCQCRQSCCQDANPPITEKRKKIIIEYLKQHRIDIQQPFTTADYSYPTVDSHLFCTFYDKETGKCSVHAVKPETCKAGPITFDVNFHTKKVEWFLKKSDICAYAAALWGDKPAFERHFESAKEQLSQLIAELSPEELRAIVKIDEPQTFKIGEDDLPPAVIKKLRLK